MVALALRTQREKRNKTLSIIDIPDLLWTQTSLPYIKIGFITASNSLNCTLGGVGVMDRNLWRTQNKAFLPWSHKYG